MLYLEDYLEMIKHLPQEMRDRFTEMRELDLQVQNNVDTLEKRVKILFNECKRIPEVTPTLDGEFQSIRQEYHKALEDADEKVHLANSMYDLVDKYLRRLDSELHKFKCELEADNKGITEVLEKRSLELDAPLANAALPSQKENRYERYNRPRAEKRRDSTNVNSIPEKRQMVATGSAHNSVQSHGAPSAAVSAGNTPAPPYHLGQIAAGQAIATAASQAIAATQQMQQGRRTTSMKASYEAAITGINVHELAIGKDLAGAAHTAFQQSISHDTNKKKQKKVSAAAAASMQQVAAPAGSSTPASPAVDVQTQEVTDGEWTYDPNEPRYCLCNQVSYGDMVACDNEDCPSEWFHYPCVGITAPPKGKWYCPQCVTMKRRSRKN